MSWTSSSLPFVSIAVLFTLGACGGGSETSVETTAVESTQVNLTTTTVLEHEVPDVVGLGIVDARALLTSYGLTAAVKVLPLSAVEVDGSSQESEVIAQEPTVGTRLPTAGRVTLSVYPEYLVVPAVRGLTRDEAFRTLSGLGLAVTVKESMSSQPPGSALTTSPGKGLVVGPGSAIELRIAIPVTHTISLNLSVRDGLWDYIGDTGCQFLQQGLEANRTVQLIGPNDVALSAATLSGGRVSDVGCEWDVVFANIPEVATYSITVSSSSEGWPSLSLADMRAQSWRAQFYVDAN